MERPRETRLRDGRSWQLGRAEDVAWINEATQETPGNGIGINIPALFATYWTIDVPGSADHDHSEELSLRLDAAVIDVFVAHTAPQPWWLGFLDRGWSNGPTNLVFPDAPQFNVVNGGHVLIEAGPEQALAWRDVDGRLNGSLPDVMFPLDRSWLVVTNWDDYWMSAGGPAALLQDFVSHELLGDYVNDVDYEATDATPPGHDVWWHRDN